jgi:hypothetical protein
MKAANRSAAELDTASKNLQWMSRWMAMPASIVVLLAGGQLVSVANWDFSQGWIHVGTTTLIGAAVVGAALIAPANRRLLVSLRDEGSVNAALDRMKAGLVLVQLMLLVAMWAMVAKSF